MPGSPDSAAQESKLGKSHPFGQLGDEESAPANFLAGCGKEIEKETGGKRRNKYGTEDDGGVPSMKRSNSGKPCRPEHQETGTDRKCYREQLPARLSDTEAEAFQVPLVPEPGNDRRSTRGPHGKDRQYKGRPGIHGRCCLRQKVPPGGAEEEGQDEEDGNLSAGQRCRGRAATRHHRGVADIGGSEHKRSQLNL